MNARQDIYVIGYPRSGNVWCSRLLGDLLNSPVQARAPKHSIADEGFSRSGKYIIRQEHLSHGKYQGEQPVVLVVRDPRDVAVSAWKYWKRPSLINTIHLMGNGGWPLPHGGGWSEFYRWWLDNRNYLTVVSYEDLLANPKIELEIVCERLGVTVDIAHHVDEVIQRQSFDVRKEQAQQHGDDMPYGKAVQVGALRKGISGDWRNHFDRECRLMAQHYFAEIAERFGYNLDVRDN